MLTFLGSARHDGQDVHDLGRTMTRMESTSEAELAVQVIRSLSSDFSVLRRDDVCLVMQLDSLAGANAARGRGRFGPQGPPNFRGINGALVSQLNEQEQGDRAPTAAALAAFATVCQDLTKAIAAWDRLTTTDLAAVNSAIKARGGSAVAVPAGRITVPNCI